MIKDDRIYQVLLKYNFDLFRGDKNITEYMKEHCDQFYNDICDAVQGDNFFLGEDFVNLLKGELEELHNICSIIPVILELYDKGLIKTAYEEGFQLFERMKPYFYTRYSWRENGGFYYRIRQGDFRIKDGEDSKEKKMQLFHIKKTLRNRVGAYRYSVAGSPCLYLASDKELAWFECGMPKQFSYCQMLIDEDNDNGLVLIDFSFRPVDVLSSFTCWLLNARRQNKDVDSYYKFLLRYIMVYPIVAACSVKVKDRKTRFVEEYVFPQLFMQWIRETDEFDGVRYKSSLNTNLVDGMGAINIALPVKEYREDGLDKRLVEKIKVSDIGYLDVNSDFQRYNDILEEIKNYINSMRMFINQVPFYGDYMMELTDVCRCVIKTYNALMEGNYQNSELVFSYLDLLCDHASLLYANRDLKIQECINKTEERHIQDIDEEELKEQFEEFHQLMNKILRKHAVFDAKKFLTADYVWDFFYKTFEQNAIGHFDVITNKYKLSGETVLEKGENYYAIFKTILLLNILYRVTTTDADTSEKSMVKPSTSNLLAAFSGVLDESEVLAILDYIDEKQILHRNPDGVFEVASSALPQKKILEEKKKLYSSKEDVSKIVEEYAIKCLGKLRTSVSRDVLRELDAQVFWGGEKEHLLRGKISAKFKNEYSLKVALILYRGETKELDDILNRAEVDQTVSRDTMLNISKEDEYKNIVFVLVNTELGNRRFEAYLDSLAQEAVARSLQMDEERIEGQKNAEKWIAQWIDEIIASGMADIVFRGDVIHVPFNQCSKYLIKNYIGVIFKYGLDMLPAPNTAWIHQTSKSAVEWILYTTTKSELEVKKGADAVVKYLLTSGNAMLFDERLQLISDDKHYFFYKTFFHKIRF